MKNNIALEVSISLGVVVLAILLLNPFHFWMPDMMHMLVLAITLVTFAFFAVFVIRENAGDERETSNKMLSGRVAFLAGSALLTLAIVVQSFQGTVDVWLVVVLVVMVLSKVITGMYGDTRL